ncbi:MAG: DUF4270 domain-containing protein [Dysgonamonadaceae bacterium]|jgi:hypothetical protein|nr:DUF4270 domain-containing protein [Dysgonamonadaceae bacterium]
MKYKVILLSFLSGILFWACEDSINSVGTGILPDEDKIGVYTDTIYLEASTVKLDSIYAKTIYGMVGEFYDPTYGSLKSSYLCQFYAPSKHVFPDSVINNAIDSVVLRIAYYSYLGDSLAPMEVSVYPVTKALDKHYYTNMSPSDYCDMSRVWGRQGYTARDLNVSDSANIANYYLKKLYVRLPDSIGRKLYNEWRKPAPNAFGSLSDFVKFFPGVYVAPTYGIGNILYVEGTYIDVYFNYLATAEDSQGNDSTYVASGASTFNVTKEIIQLNSYQSSNDEKLLRPSEDKAYVKTPAGIFTKITIPIPDIVEKMGKKKFTNAKLSLSVFGKDEWEYAIGYPQKVLLINSDSIVTFFEKRQVADNRTSYTTIFSGTSGTVSSPAYTYNFGNISAVIQNAISEKPDKNLELLIIPVSTQTSGSTDYSTSHYLYPSGITFKKGREHLKLSIVATDMDVEQLK